MEERKIQVFCEECGSSDVEVRGIKLMDYVRPPNNAEYLITCRACGKSGWIGKAEELSKS